MAIAQQWRSLPSANPAHIYMNKIRLRAIHRDVQSGAVL
jgi:hypothetical protein